MIAGMRGAYRLLLTFLAAVVLVGTAGPVRAVVPPFSDIDGHRFEADINWLRTQELTNGCGGGRFCPDGLVTRAQMASFLARALDLPATGADHFTDDEGLGARGRDQPRGHRRHHRRLRAAAGSVRRAS